MTFFAPRVATFLQIAYPALIALEEAVTFPATYADAQRFAGPPSYLPAVVLVGLLCMSLFFTAFLLWRRSSLGWLLTILLDGAVALFTIFFVVHDHLGKWAMPLGADILLISIGMSFGVIPVLLILRPSLAFFAITTAPSSAIQLDFPRTS